MAKRSLTEAAQEVLNKSRNAPGMSMPKGPANPKDIGGETLENPQGNEIGSASASAVSKAPQPGTNGKGVPGGASGEPMKKLAGSHPSAEGSSAGREEVDPDDLNGPQGKNYVKPVAAGSARANEETEGEGEELDEEEEVELTEEELAEARTEKVERMKEKMKAHSMKEDVDAVLSGEDFSEDFKNKLTTIFEAAVIARAITVVEEMEEEILAAADETVEEIKGELEEGIDNYLTALAEEWKEENKLAVETGLKSEIMEDFVSGLKELCAENYIEFPSDKVDVVEALSSEVAELTERLNTIINSNIELTTKINEAKKTEVTNTVCEGLTATQAEKVKTLAESVEFTTEGEYENKLKTIRESYFSGGGKGVKQAQPSSVVALVEGSDEPAAGVVDKGTSDVMNRYVNAIQRAIR